MVQNAGFHEGEAFLGWCRKCDEKRLFAPLYRGHACTACGMRFERKLLEIETFSGIDMWVDPTGRAHRTIIVGHEEKGRFVVDREIRSTWRS